MRVCVRGLCARCACMRVLVFVQVSVGAAADGVRVQVKEGFVPIVPNRFFAHFPAASMEPLEAECEGVLGFEV